MQIVVRKLVTKEMGLYFSMEIKKALGRGCSLMDAKRDARTKVYIKGMKQKQNASQFDLSFK